jgi:hypothetical protein
VYRTKKMELNHKIQAKYGAIQIQIT